MQLELFLGVVERLLCKGQRLFVHLRLLVRVHQVPINVLNLGHGRHHLVFEGNIRNLLIIFRDSQISEVWAEAKSGKQLLLEREAVHRAQGRGQVEERTIRGLTIVVELEGNARSRGEGLCKTEIRHTGVQLQQRNSVDSLVRQRSGLMLRPH